MHHENRNFVCIAFVGNAAHAVHPVAGQGFNLGLRDIKLLAKQIEKNRFNNQGKFIFSQSIISDYWQQRQHDIQMVSGATDGLIRLFSNQTFPLTPARNLGLSLLDSLPPIKQQLVRLAMGA